MFKIGDTVRVKHSFTTIKGRINLAPEMVQYAGKAFVIRDTWMEVHVKLNNCKDLNGTANGDGYWAWDPLWLERADDKFEQYKQNLLKE